MELQKAVGIWIRVSTEDQVKGESPEHHERRARAYAEAKGWDVKTIYHLEAISGKSVMHHDEAKRMIADIKRGFITGLIFSKLARLARNTRELLDFADMFRDSQADLISLHESIDTSTPAGRLFYTMIAAMAQWEREEIADRVAASVPVRAQMGKPLGGQASFGYRWDGKELVVEEQEAPIRKQVYELFKEHRRKTTVATLLNKQGHRTRNGSQFSDTTIGRLLRDTTAKGLRIANYTKSLGEGKKWEYKDEKDWVRIRCAAIVSEELWNECNHILDVQEKKRNKPAKRPVHLFTGILQCSCGAKLYVPSGSKKYVCQKCRATRIATEDIEEIYYEYLKSFLVSDDQIETFLAKADTTIREKETLKKTIEENQRKVQKEMDQLVKLHLAGEIPKDGFKNYYDPLNEQLKQIETSLPEIQSEIDFLKVEYLNGDDIFHEAKNLYGRWQKLETDSKRRIVEQITERILISTDEIKIRFNYNPSISQIAPDSQRNLTDSCSPPA